MLEYFVKDGFIFIIILIVIIVGLTCFLVSNIEDLRDQRKNNERLDREVIVVSTLSALAIVYLLFLLAIGILNDRKLSYAAKHDAIAKHYTFKKDGNHLLLMLKNPDESNNYKDNILLDLSSETKDSYHVIFHGDLYNIPKSDKKQATRIENTLETSQKEN